jgi:hypothetical protein
MLTSLAKTKFFLFSSQSTNLCAFCAGHRLLLVTSVHYKFTTASRGVMKLFNFHIRFSFS